MRDPLVTPAVGDVIEGRDGDSVYRWTVEEIDGRLVRGSVVARHADGSVEVGPMDAADMDEWADWSEWRDVRVVPPARDPLVDPEPGDVVRAKSGGIPAVVVVLDAADGLVGYAVCWPGHREATVYEETLDEWRDWSEWTDVAVLS